MLDLDENREWSRVYGEMREGSSSSSRLNSRPPDARWTRRPNNVSRNKSFMEKGLICDF